MLPTIAIADRKSPPRAKTACADIASTRTSTHLMRKFRMSPRIYWAVRKAKWLLKPLMGKAEEIGLNIAWKTRETLYSVRARGEHTEIQRYTCS
jgi:hypothetical protein